MQIVLAVGCFQGAVLQLPSSRRIDRLAPPQQMRDRDDNPGYANILVQSPGGDDIQVYLQVNETGHCSSQVPKRDHALGDMGPSISRSIHPGF
ncbi:hypothetical protein PHYSODRAFT_285743 [Phytophthora sojae]|uniref:Uncharacterized protein n=1 Tax=Phytophthora sojae (strain P6497) TaxID=1094619 RepID=G4Z8K5_PHYSP|nr:hypothetical protein PHYSODRAFT_285743 [Phytophthora sojae]EGZ22556.1 hypothetical protein PHYSODRAFT_285743 [Phytophthora sojae]|eukprot:XP_009525273.1 hypothetical protein PHYSODRAFT_285743 [Phytophthora sojae]